MQKTNQDNRTQIYGSSQGKKPNMGKTLDQFFLLSISNVQRENTMIQSQDSLAKRRSNIIVLR